MRYVNRLVRRAAAAIAVVAMSACSADGPESVLAPVTGPMSSTSEDNIPHGYVDVYKIGPEGTYFFEATETGSGLYDAAFSVAAGGKKTIWSQGDQAMGNSSVTIVELEAAGTQLDSIVVSLYTDSRFTSRQTLTGTRQVTLYDLNNTTDAAVKFYNSEVPPPPPPPSGGTEGCTPGYWRQPQHFDSWVGYQPTDSFGTVFGVDHNGTLLQAVTANGGGVNALARHAVAALLNAGSTVDYAVNTAQVIQMVQAAFASGDFEATKDAFEGWNELGCPLN